MVHDILRGTFSCHPVPPAAALFFVPAVRGAVPVPSTCSCCVCQPRGWAHTSTQQTLPSWKLITELWQSRVLEGTEQGTQPAILALGMWGKGSDPSSPPVTCTDSVSFSKFILVSKFIWGLLKPQQDFRWTTLPWKMTRNSHVLHYSWVSA